MQWRGGVALGVIAGLGAASPAAASLQTDYDAGQAAFNQGQWHDARDRFAALLARMPATQTHTAALIAARIGVAESRLGNPTAAIARLSAALPALTRPGDDEERIVARTEFAAAYEAAADLATAAREYALVAAEPHFAASDVVTVVQLGLVRTAVFADPARARRDLDALLPALVTRLAADKVQLAQLYELRGSIELNDQKFDAARKWFDKALPLTGGLTERITIPGQRVRGDLAIVAFRSGHADDARKFLAYTGTGYLPLAALKFGETMPMPPCAPLSPLQPDDVAVIEIAIADSGKVAHAATIYASRNGGPETVFAETARDWVWDRDAIANLPAFYRAALRLEVRCNTSRGDDAVGIGLFRRDLETWAARSRVEPLPELPDDPVLARAALAAEGVRRTAAYGPDSPQLFPVVFESIRLGTRDEARATIARAVALAMAGNAPRDAVWALRAVFVPAVPDTTATHMRNQRDEVAALGTLIAAAASEDAGGRGLAYLRLRLGIAAEAIRDDDMATAALRAVIAAPTAVVPAADPIHLVALLRLASIEAARQQLAEASALYHATGLSAGQCALVDVRPLPTNLSVGEGDFPREALRYGFEGVVRVGYDIDTAGKPVGVRTITAVPPFAFSAGTERTAAGFRYRPIFRDGPGIGCSGFSTSVRYKIERHR